MKERYDAVPMGTDIVLSHGPPYGYGDALNGALVYLGGEFKEERVGSRAATDMLSRVHPGALVCGHIHEGFGSYRHTGPEGHVTDIYLVSYVDEFYSVRRKFAKTLVEIELEK